MKFAITGLRRAVAAAGALWLALIVVCVPASADPAIWRVEGGPKPVWLFGTFHLLPKDTHWQTPTIEAAFRNADALVVEVILNDKATAVTRAIVKKKAFLNNGRKLRDYLSREDQATYDMIGNRLGMFPAILDNYRPWYASVLLSVALFREQGFRPDSGVDMRLQMRARTVGKPIEQFETAGEQMNFLADMPEKMQIDMLKATLHDAETVPDEIETLLTAWKNGDAKALDRLLNESMRDFPKLYDRLLVQRNRNWLPRIEHMIKDRKGYFIAVGTAHLVGKDGLVALLRKKGYRVRGP